MRDGEVVYWIPPWREIIVGAGMYSLMISQLSMALIGGNAISGERVDRSAEFLYSLPIARRRFLASKLVLALAITAAVWLVNVAVVWCLTAGPLAFRPDEYKMLLTGVGYIAITGLMFFSAAWFFSSFVGSPAFDVCGGLIFPLVVWSGIWLMKYLLKWHINEEMLGNVYFVVCLVLAPMCFGVGTWYYLRRVEP